MKCFDFIGKERLRKIGYVFAALYCVFAVAWVLAQGRPALADSDPQPRCEGGYLQMDGAKLYFEDGSPALCGTHLDAARKSGVFADTATRGGVSVRETETVEKFTNIFAPARTSMSAHFLFSFLLAALICGFLFMIFGMYQFVRRHCLK